MQKNGKKGEKMELKTGKRDKKAVYYVNPKTEPEPHVKLYCANTRCVNFIPVHQTCNLKSVLINEKGKCEFFTKKKVKRNQNL